MCFDFLYNFFFSNVSHSKKNSKKYYHTFTHKSTSYFFVGKYDISKNPQISNSMKIRAVGAELFHADIRTDKRDDSNSRFVFQCCKSS